ncbi:MAG TPA: hypothetical protein VJB92_02205 [Candidatus Paceibacterota bacterium]
MAKPDREKINNQSVLDAISELALAVEAGFDKVDKRFDRVDKRLVDLQEQINRIETYILQDHQRRLETIEHKLGIER